MDTVGTQHYMVVVRRVNYSEVLVLAIVQSVRYRSSFTCNVSGIYRLVYLLRI